MKCPYCGYDDDKVIDSRATEEGTSIRRRRECVQCQRRFTTYEKVETIPLVVIKKDGSRQSFDRSKITNSILRACEKRSVTMSEIERIANEIEASLMTTAGKEVASYAIGEMILDKLKNFDEVVYVRFASVYRKFKDINQFADELVRLKREKSE